MAKIYTTQVWTIGLDTGEDQTSATAPLIYTRAPDGTEASFVGSVSTNTISKKFAVTEIATKGLWTFWAGSTISGDVAIGEPVEIEIHAPGDMTGK